MTAPVVPPDGRPLAIICGGGALPAAVAAAAARQGRRVVLFPLQGSAEPAWVAAYPHHWIRLGQVGRFCRLARQEGCQDAVWIGGLVRPALTEVRLDWQTLLLLPRVARALRAGDDGLLRELALISAELGFRLVGAHDVAPELLMPQGVLTRRAPDQHDLADVRRGLDLLRVIGPFDIGQGAVIVDGRVLAIEAAEGTDGMLANIAELRRVGRIRTPLGKGVLMKAPKPGQDTRFDLPAIGPRTIAGLAKAGLGGLAVVAGGTIVAEPDKLVNAANGAGLFVVGVAADGSLPGAMP